MNRAVRVVSYGCPYRWAAHLRGGVGTLEAGQSLPGTVKPIHSPMFVPFGIVERFTFSPIEPGWPPVEVKLNPSDVLDYAMHRATEVGADDARRETHSVHFGVRRGGAHGTVVGRVYALGDGRLIPYLGDWDPLEEILRRNSILP